MRTRTRRRFVPGVALAIIAVAAAATALALVRGHHRPAPAAAPAPRPTTYLSVGGPLAAPPVPVGFLGFSTEYSSIEPYAGTDPAALDPAFVRLIRALTQGQPTVVRIGGDSADHTWWPVSALTQPPGVTYTLDERWLNVTRALAGAINAKLILGIDLEADSLELASAESDALVSGLGANDIEAFELGNEPELYDSFAWYRTAEHHGVTGRPRNHYTLADFTQDYALFASVLPHLTLAGPTIGGPGWLKRLSSWLSDEPRVGLVTVHRYPLQSCFVKASSPAYPTVARLLAPASSTGLADDFAPLVAIAHAHGLPIRIDELNSVSCGADPSVSYTFGSALWALEAMFEMARIGVGGVNIHTFPGAGYELVKVSQKAGQWQATTSPEYYGLLLFAQAAPPGARLLQVNVAGSAPSVRAWATQLPGGRTRVVAVDADPSRPAVLALSVPQARGKATLWQLRGPSLNASSGVTVAGQSFGVSGLPSGRLDAPRVAPRKGRYLVRLPAASAVLITFGNSARVGG